MHVPVNRFVLLLCAGLTLIAFKSPQLVRASESYALARGDTCNVSEVDQHDGTTSAEAEVSGTHSASGASWEARSSVVQGGDSINSVSLSAYAIASPPAEFNETTWLCRCSAEARATFYDELTIVNPQILDSRPNGVFVLILPIQLDGNFHFVDSHPVNDASVVFSASLASRGGMTIGGWPAYSLSKYDSSIVDGSEIDLLTSPAVAVDLTQPVVSLYMSLNVEASAWPGTAVSYSNFSQTAKTFPIIVADLEGQPIPGSESLQIIGTSGITYAVVPEPSLGILYSSVFLLMACRRSSRRHA